MADPTRSTSSLPGSKLTPDQLQAILDAQRVSTTQGGPTAYEEEVARREAQQRYEEDSIVASVKLSPSPAGGLIGDTIDPQAEATMRAGLRARSAYTSPVMANAAAIHQGRRTYPEDFDQIGYTPRPIGAGSGTGGGLRPLPAVALGRSGGRAKLSEGEVGAFTQMDIHQYATPSGLPASQSSAQQTAERLWNTAKGVNTQAQREMAAAAVGQTTPVEDEEAWTGYWLVPGLPMDILDTPRRAMNALGFGALEALPDQTGDDDSYMSEIMEVGRAAFAVVDYSVQAFNYLLNAAVQPVARAALSASGEEGLLRKGAVNTVNFLLDHETELREWAAKWSPPAVRLDDAERERLSDRIGDRFIEAATSGEIREQAAAHPSLTVWGNTKAVLDAISPDVSMFLMPGEQGRWQNISGVDVLNASIDPDEARLLAGDAAARGRRLDAAVLGALSTEGGRTMFGIALDILADPLWLVGPAKMGKVVAVADEVWNLARPAVVAARELIGLAGGSTDDAARIVVQAMKGEEAALGVVRQGEAAVTERVTALRAEAARLAERGAGDALVTEARAAAADARTAMEAMTADAAAYKGAGGAEALNGLRRQLAAAEEVVGRAAKNPASYVKARQAAIRKQLSAAMEAQANLRAIAQRTAPGWYATEKGLVDLSLPLGEATYSLGKWARPWVTRTVDAGFGRLGAVLEPVNPRAINRRVREIMVASNLSQADAVATLGLGERMLWAAGNYTDKGLRAASDVWKLLGSALGTRFLRPVTMAAEQMSRIWNKDAAAMSQVTRHLRGTTGLIDLPPVTRQLWDDYQGALGRFFDALGSRESYLRAMADAVRRDAHEAHALRIRAAAAWQKAGRPADRMVTVNGMKIRVDPHWLTSEYANQQRFVDSIVEEAAEHLERGSGLLDPTSPMFRAELQPILRALEDVINTTAHTPEGVDVAQAWLRVVRSWKGSREQANAAKAALDEALKAKKAIEDEGDEAEKFIRGAKKLEKQVEALAKLDELLTEDGAARALVAAHREMEAGAAARPKPAPAATPTATATLPEATTEMIRAAGERARKLRSAGLDETIREEAVEEIRKAVLQEAKGDPAEIRRLLDAEIGAPPPPVKPTEAPKPAPEAAPTPTATATEAELAAAEAELTSAKQAVDATAALHRGASEKAKVGRAAMAAELPNLDRLASEVKAAKAALDTAGEEAAAHAKALREAEARLTDLTAQAESASAELKAQAAASEEILRDQLARANERLAKASKPAGAASAPTQMAPEDVARIGRLRKMDAEMARLEEAALDRNAFNRNAAHREMAEYHTKYHRELEAAASQEGMPFVARREAEVSRLEALLAPLRAKEQKAAEEARNAAAVAEKAQKNHLAKIRSRTATLAEVDKAQAKVEAAVRAQDEAERLLGDVASTAQAVSDELAVLRGQPLATTDEIEAWYKSRAGTPAPAPASAPKGKRATAKADKEYAKLEAEVADLEAKLQALLDAPPGATTSDEIEALRQRVDVLAHQRDEAEAALRGLRERAPGSAESSQLDEAQRARGAEMNELHERESAANNKLKEASLQLDNLERKSDSLALQISVKRHEIDSGMLTKPQITAAKSRITAMEKEVNRLTGPIDQAKRTLTIANIDVRDAEEATRRAEQAWEKQTDALHDKVRAAKQSGVRGASERLEAAQAAHKKANDAYADLARQQKILDAEVKRLDADLAGVRNRQVKHADAVKAAKLRVAQEKAAAKAAAEAAAKAKAQAEAAAAAKAAEAARQAEVAAPDGAYAKHTMREAARNQPFDHKGREAVRAAFTERLSMLVPRATGEEARAARAARIDATVEAALEALRVVTGEASPGKAAEALYDMAMAAGKKAAEVRRTSASVSAVSAAGDAEVVAVVKKGLEELRRSAQERWDLLTQLLRAEQAGDDATVGRLLDALFDKAVKAARQRALETGAKVDELNAAYHGGDALLALEERLGVTKARKAVRAWREYVDGVEGRLGRGQATADILRVQDALHTLVGNEPVVRGDILATRIHALFQAKGGVVQGRHLADALRSFVPSSLDGKQAEEVLLAVERAVEQFAADANKTGDMVRGEAVSRGTAAIKGVQEGARLFKEEVLAKVSATQQEAARLEGLREARAVRLEEARKKVKEAEAAYEQAKPTVKAAPGEMTGPKDNRREVGHNLWTDGVRREALEWEEAIWNEWRVASEGYTQEEALTALAGLLREAPLVPEVAGQMGQRLGRLPPELAPLAGRMRQLFDQYETWYKAVGFDFMADPIERLRAWGTVGYVPHFRPVAEDIASGDIYRSFKPAGTTRGSGSSAIDGMLSMKMNAKERRAIGGVAAEINAAAADHSVRFDLSGMLNRYLQSGKAISAAEYFVLLLRTKVAARFDPVVEAGRGLVRTADEVAREAGYVPLFQRSVEGRDIDLLLTGTVDDWARAGVTKEEIAEAVKGLRGRTAESPFGTWVNSVPLLQQTGHFEQIVLAQRAADYAAGRPLWSPLQRVDELRAAGMEGGVLWRELAEEVNGIAAKYGLRHVEHEALEALLTDKGWRIYIPAQTAESMIRLFEDTAPTSLAGRVFKGGLDWVNGMYKSWFTIAQTSFTARNAASNFLSNVLDIGVHGALNLDTNIKATALYEASNIILRYGSIKAAQAAAGSHVGLGGRLSFLSHFIDNGIDLGDGVLRTLDEAVEVALEHNVLARGYTPLGDMSAFNASMSANYFSLMESPRAAIEAAVKELPKQALDYGLTAMSILGGTPLAVVPRKFGAMLAQFVETQARGVNFIAGLKGGRSVEDAGRHVQRFLFNYEDLTNFQKTWMRTLIPFFTWTQKNLLLQAEMIRETPAFYQKMSQALNGLAELSEALDRDAGLVVMPRQVYSDRETRARSEHLQQRFILPLPKALTGIEGIGLTGLGTPQEGAMDLVAQIGELVNLPKIAAGDYRGLRLLAQANFAVRMVVEGATQSDVFYGRGWAELNNARDALQTFAALEKIRQMDLPVVSPFAAATHYAMQMALQPTITIQADTTSRANASPWRLWVYRNLPISQTLRKAASGVDAYAVAHMDDPRSAQQVWVAPHWLRVLNTFMGIATMQDNPYDIEASDDRRDLEAWHDFLQREGTTRASETSRLR